MARRELSLLCVRSLRGELAFYPPVQNVHSDGILRLTLAPAPNLTAELQQLAQKYAERLLVHLDFAGVLALEFFEVSGQLLANEFAPRVHNSGHFTIEGAVTSQFENHLRAIAHLPLGDTSVRGSVPPSTPSAPS
jgi:5-(carboxyamino)imidazole ribonucleotide synthase